MSALHCHLQRQITQDKLIVGAVAKVNLDLREGGTSKEKRLLQGEMLFSFFSFLLAGISIGPVQCLTCLDCTNVQSPQDCIHATECQHGEVCHVHRSTNQYGDAVFNVGCVHPSQCQRHTMEISQLVGRSIYDDTRSLAETVCQKCCDDDLCNDHCDVGYCSPDPCEFGTCISTKTGYKCLCDQYHIGVNCSADVGKCPNGWEQRPKSDDCYLITDNTDHRNRDDASAECQKQQGHLVKVDSIEERDWLRQKMDYLRQTQGLFHFWVGLSNRPRTDNTGFKWEDQTYLDTSILPWRPDQPDNNYGLEHCGDLWNGELNDNNCNEQYPYICEMYLSPPQNLSSTYVPILNTSTSPTGTPSTSTAPPTPDVCKCPNDWEQRPGSDDCYLITDIKDMRDHDGASAECQKHQGHLVKVDSIQERDWLRQKVVNLWQTQRLVFFWVGLSNRPRTDNTGFKWEDQTDLDTNILPWRPGQPDADGSEHCGDLWYGELNDDDCNEPFPYICEIPKSLWIASLASSSSLDDFHAVQNKLNCTFDADFCQWSQVKNDYFDWTRHTGSTPTDETGPTTDHGGSGWYLFIETSAPRVLDEEAVLISPFIDTCNNVAMCFQMFYHANGASLGDLQVTLETSGYGNSTVQEFSGPLNSSDTWERLAFTINPIPKFQIRIRGTVGNGYLGDIAIDDVSVTPGECPP
ncbi:uncharacterized protein LOC127835323 isoform X2 [Dreissena polymorpha]|uniref:uncharacterized protein LOC127835323 isoform X2 n=1 Tax=Dreissena polymorpha TaxID=45954 RepID=UPI002263BBB5|nr:uncharacterized protein LOC127835323 isoform X2 [Dreissena polymorpha]